MEADFDCPGSHRLVALIVDSHTWVWQIVFEGVARIVDLVGHMSTSPDRICGAARLDFAIEEYGDLGI